MTDNEIGKTAREIAEKGLNAIVKKNKDGIVILKEKCEIVRLPGKKNANLGQSLNKF